MAGFRRIGDVADAEIFDFDDLGADADFIANYFLKIEALFSELRGRSALLSPADYQLAKGWFNAGVPLSCALGGMRDAHYYDKELHSLKRCQRTVIKRFMAEGLEMGTPIRAEIKSSGQEKGSRETKHWGKHENYKEYMGSPEWKQLSEFVKKRAGWKCQTCNSSIDLVAHHRSYEKGADENGENCIAICKRCHALIHQIKEDQ